MANIFLAFYRSAPEGGQQRLKQRLEKLEKHLKPTAVNTTSYSDANDKAALLVLSMHEGILVKDLNICSGVCENISSDWWNLSEMPASASFRAKVNDDFCEISANLVATRSLWYFFDENYFFAATSQRALIAWLGTFQFNQQALSWMLSTGNLGPGNSWDLRIKHLEAGQTIKLDRISWKLGSTKREKPSENLSALTHSELKHRMQEILDTNFSRTKFLSSKNILTLSGGYDSRLVLYYLVKNGINIKTATWGLSSAQDEKYTDSNIAAEIASQLNVDHRYFNTDFREHSFEPLLDHFLLSGEGRLDHINSFMDGFTMWEQLYKEGFRTVVRADEVFGWLPARTVQDVRISLDFHMMEDNANMSPLEDFGMERQKYPEEMLQRPKESLESWRDRLYREFRLPYVISALHDVIQPYMEVVNPLLNSNIIEFCKKIPDHYRTGKNLYSKYVDELIPQVPIARKASIPEPAAILKSARIVSLILDELASQECRNLMGSKFINWNMENLGVDDNLINTTNGGFAVWVKSHIPWKLKKILRRDFIRYSADFNQLAFRAVIITRMNNMLNKDKMLFENN